MPKGNYIDICFQDFSGGLATKVEDNKINDNQSPDLQNIVFDGKGYIMPRLGTSCVGGQTSATGKIRTTWTTINALNREIPVRQVDNATNCWLEYLNPNTSLWENLDAGYTTGYDMGHAYYDYYSYYGSQPDFQRRWNGIVSTISAAVGIGWTSCAISASTWYGMGLLSAGSIVVDGEEIYYSSAGGQVLTTTAFTAAHAAGKALAQLPTSALEVPAPDGGWVSASSAWPHGSIMYEMDSQIFVAGLSSSLSAWNGNVVWYSQIDAPTTYIISATAGGGGSARYPEAGGSITGLADFDGILTVLKENTIRQLKFTQMGTDAGITEIVDRKNIVTAPKTGAIGNKSVTRVENDLIYVTPSGWVKSLTATTTPGRAPLNELSKPIRPTVEGLTMTSAAGIYFDGKYYLACATSASSVNDTVLVWDYDYNSWTRFVGWNVADWFVYNQNLYYGASNEIATYRALLDYSDNGGAVECYWLSKGLDFGIPNEQKKLGEIYMEGYMTTNTKLGVSAYFDGDLASPIAKTIDGSDTNYIYSSDAITVLGTNTWGRGTHGGGAGGTAYSLKKFRWWGRYSGANFYNMQIKVGTATAGYVWKVTHIAPYLMRVPGKRIPINSLK